jgi:hypothetical protein
MISGVRAGQRREAWSSTVKVPVPRLGRVEAVELLSRRVRSGRLFVRTSTLRNWDGSKVSYLPLAHNEWDSTAKTAQTNVLYSFGRADRWIGLRSSG